MRVPGSKECGDAGKLDVGGNNQRRYACFGGGGDWGGGLVATSGAQFVESIRGMCERQKTGQDYRARRELVAKFTQVWKKDASGWKLARVLSYDHKLME